MAELKEEVLNQWNRGEIPAGTLIEVFIPDLLPRIDPDQEINSALEALRRALIYSRPQFTISPKYDFLMYAEGVFKNTSRIREELSDLTLHSLDIRWADKSILSPEEQLEFIEAEDQLWRESRQQENRIIQIGTDSLHSLMTLDEIRPPGADLILAPETARILALRLVTGLTFPEIAARLTMPVEEIHRQWALGQTVLTEVPMPSANDYATLVSFDLLDTAILRAVHEHPELLRTLQPREFERLLARALDLLGYEIELGRGTKDGGVDIFAIKRDSALGHHRYLIQAKRWKHRVGIEPVRELIFLHQHYRATKSCLATTSTFTRGAWALGGEYSWQLELKDYDLLKQWLYQAARKL